MKTDGGINKAIVVEDIRSIHDICAVSLHLNEATYVCVRLC